MADSIRFSIETAGESLNDLQLCVIPQLVDGRDSDPRWMRRRVLGSKEIVDELLDVQTGRICWTAHRPVEGWFLYIRSPLLPRDAAIQLTRPSKRTFQGEPGSRPLSLQITTRPNLSALVSEDRTAKHSRTASNPFTSINLEHTSIETTDQQPSRSTGLTDSKTHARRRSSGVSSSKATQHASRRSVSGAKSTPIITESNAEGSDEARRLCTIVLSDGQINVSDNVLHAGPAAQQTSWARRAWKAMPTFARPELNLDSSNSFSIWWTDADRPVEVARFEDQESARWSWSSKRKGTLSIQKDASLSLNVDIALWVALCLAYMEYLNERKGFDAAYDA